MAGGKEVETAAAALVGLAVHAVTAAVGFASDLAKQGRLNEEDIDALEHRLMPPPPTSTDPTVLAVDALVRRKTALALEAVRNIARRWDDMDSSQPPVPKPPGR